MSLSKFTLNNVRSLNNYGLHVSGNTIDPIFERGWLQTKPNILINGGSCYIDYSHTFNVSDLTYINHTFKKLGVGANFYLKPSEYYDAEKNILTNLGGTLSVSQLLNDNRLIVTNIVSGITGVCGYNYFIKENFNYIPQYIFQNTTPFTGYYLINSMPDLSKITFETMGILGDDFGYEEYISLSAGICENSERIQVAASSTLKDKQEILYFLNGGTFQNMGNTLCAVDLYLRGDPELLKAPVKSSVTGIYTVSSINSGALIYCFENQSLNQANLRKESLDSTSTFGDFVNCESCKDLIYGSANTMTFADIGDFFNNLIFLQIVDATTASALSASVGSFLLGSTTAVRVPITNSRIIKIDLSHPSLIDYDLVIYTDPSRETLLGGTNFMKYGVVGYNNSYGIVKNYVANTTLYCTLQGISTINFTIQV